jgi:hypothetical protein
MPKRPSNNGWKYAASSSARSKPTASSGHAAEAAAIAAMAAIAAAGQRNRAWLQAATLALAALPNGITSNGSAPISKIACTLFSRPSTHNAAASAIPSGRAMPARRPATVRISSAKITGQAATSSLRKTRECTAMPPENAKASVAASAMRQSRTTRRTRNAKINTQPVAISQARRRPARTALVIAASNAVVSDAGGMADNA